jgi:5-carboxymethyl-2-hydroxymuconate isomerase
MPHLILEYSNNLADPLDHQALFAELHAALERFELFQPTEIKSRAIAHEHYRVGSGAPESVFVHLTVAILSGREVALRQQLSTELLGVLREALARTWRERPCDVTVDVREMQRETYGKAMNAPAAVTTARTA